jgi:autotransporter-associated beta strand protein
MTLENGGTLQGSWQWNGDDLLSFSTFGDDTNTIGALLNLRNDNSANHTFTVDDGASATDLLVSGTLAGSGSNVVKAGTGVMVLTGSNTHTGNTVINNGTLEVTTDGSLRFRPTINGSTNSVSGSATATLSFLGTVDLDLGAANTTFGNTWNLVNLASFTGPTPTLEAAAVTSGLGAFNEVSPGIWELPVSGAKWVFTEGDGNLAYLANATDYDDWKTANGVTGGNNDDDDNDGLSNFEEYAFGLDPTGGSSLNPIAVPLDKTSGTFSYTRRDSSLPSPPLSYTIWYSTDLSVWTEDDGAMEGVPVLNGEVETVEVTLTPALLSNSKLFIQVRAN